MKKVFSFLKLFEHERLTDVKLTDIYKTLKDVVSSQTINKSVGDDITMTRLAMSTDTSGAYLYLEVAYRKTDHKTWINIHPDGATLSDNYTWRTQSHTFIEAHWDLTFTAPEFEAGLNISNHYYSQSTLGVFPNILGVAAAIIDDKETLIDTLKSAIIEVDNEYDVYLQAYNGNIDGARLGDVVFINGQKNGKLLQAAKRTIKALDNQKRDADVHLLPYLGTMISTASFDELTSVLSFIDVECSLDYYPTYTLSSARAGKLQDILTYVKERMEKRLKELMKEHTQTVTLHQLTHDETVKEYVKNGTQVNLLLELNEMKWVD